MRASSFASVRVLNCWRGRHGKPGLEAGGSIWRVNKCLWLTIVSCDGLQHLVACPISLIPVKPLSRIVVLSFAAAWVASPAAASVIINEIHYNPDVKTDPGEFVELYNAGTNIVNLAGWTLSSGFSYTFPATNLAPGRFAV